MSIKGSGKNLHNRFSCSATGTKTDVQVLCLVIVNVNVTKYMMRNVKNDRFVAIRCVFSSSTYSKTRFRPGLSYDALPDPLVGWGHPLPMPFAFNAFGASVVSPPTQIPGYAYDI